jgi:chromosome condensin MukBEF ATPase and DNA-binding subunit MukB
MQRFKTRDGSLSIAAPTPKGPVWPMSVASVKYYREHPDFQIRQRANAIANHAKYRTYPEWRKLTAIRKDLYRIRESYNARMEHANRLERRLVQLGHDLIVAQREWAKVRALEARTQLTGQRKRRKTTDSTI